jgi:hypothetical protein
MRRPTAAIISVAISSARPSVAPSRMQCRVPVEQAEGDLVQCGLDGGDLCEHIDAVAVVVNHLLDAAYLALDATQPGE